MTEEEIKNKISEHKECCKKLAEEYRQRYNEDNADKLALNMFYHNVISFNDFEIILATIEDRNSMMMCFSEPPYLTEETVEVNIKRIAELEVTNKKISDECHKLVDSLEKKQNENELLETQNIKLQAEVSRLTIKNAELKADNDARKFAMAMSEKVEKQLREENAKLKNEWQEQVQKATDEGYARTLQTIQLSKAKNLLAKWVELFKPKGGNIPPTPIQVDTEQFLKGDGCPDCLCKDCTKDCEIKKFGLVEVEK